MPMCDKCQSEPGYIDVLGADNLSHRQCEGCAPTTVAEYIKSKDNAYEQSI